MILGLQGYGGAGKSTVAAILEREHGYARKHIKAPIVAMLTPLLAASGIAEPERYLDGDLKREMIPGFGGKTGTDLQQFIGTEFGREFIHKFLWVEIWHRWALAQPVPVVQESVRFADEAARCDVVWEVRRPGYGPSNGHASEALPVARPHAVIINDGSVEALSYTIGRLL